MIGMLLLNQYSCAQLPPQYGPAPAAHALVPAIEKNVALAPVIGSFGRLLVSERCASKFRLKRSVTCQLALKPIESSLYFCSLRCCS